MHYACALGPLTLSVRTTADPKRLDVRVVHKQGSLFQHALTIRPGITLKLVKHKAARFVKVRAFAPRLRYGHLVAGGLLEIL
jgi:hypothetical protein